MVRSVSSVAALAGFLLALLAGAAAALSGLGYRWEWWGFRQGFAVLRWAAYLGALAGAVSLAAAFSTRPGSGRRGFALAVSGLALGCALAAWPLHLSRTARGVPPIHDISTDTARPPGFSAILPLRATADNPAAYAGEPVAAQQRRAYPDVAPLVLAVAPAAAFRRSLDAARRLGWTLVAQDESAGRIEAFERTLWYGFVDDVVVRVEPLGAGSRVDVRSVSRVGKGDVGVNARRVRRFLRAVAEAS